MSWLTLTLLVLVALVDTFAAYISRVYSEFGKILPREVQDNLDEWEEKIEPLLGLTREHAALCATVLQQLTLAVFALAIGAVLFDRAPHVARPTYPEIAQAVLVVLLAVVFCNQILPSLLFTHTKGRWAARLVWPIRLLLWLTTPITAIIRFFFSLASLAEKPVAAEDEPAPDVESLLEAGEEEGILEESDRDLVRSAVEFGDKLVREVMTPRPAGLCGSAVDHDRAFSRNAQRAQFFACACLRTHARLALLESPSHTICCRSPTRRRESGPWPAFSIQRSLFRRRSTATSYSARCSAKSSTCASSSMSTEASPAW